jgi:hypothetical protein
MDTRTDLFAEVNVLVSTRSIRARANSASVTICNLISRGIGFINHLDLEMS